ncbi:hypothetical protein BDY24DRAFT_153683 [Mrakia frigida]|uniref:uncharacterized protein n=1 Tax=Mrakia frigida TaxID=29902 RepID=UPI003FCC2447
MKPSQDLVDALVARIKELEKSTTTASASKKAKLPASASTTSLATASASTSNTPAATKADTKRATATVKKWITRLKKECKSDSYKFKGREFSPLPSPTRLLSFSGLTVLCSFRPFRLRQTEATTSSSTTSSPLPTSRLSSRTSQLRPFFPKSPLPSSRSTNSTRSMQSRPSSRPREESMLPYGRTSKGTSGLKEESERERRERSGPLILRPASSQLTTAATR